jgi:hypothetical protein
MADFFKKALGAFVELPPGQRTESAAEGGGPTAPRSPDDVEQLNAEARELLAQIEAGARRSSGAPAASPPPASSPPPAGGADPAAAGTVPFGSPFPSLYSRARVAESPYSAEMLLKVAEGLRILPEAQARAAIAAMDAADDRWTTADVLLDAERKIRALSDVLSEVDGMARTAEEQFAAESSRVDGELGRIEDDVKAQTAELERIRAQARDEARSRKQQALDSLEGTRSACAQEAARLQGEVARLRQVHAILGEPEKDVRSGRNPS